MAIINKLDQNEFIRTFKDIRPDNFTYAGLSLLYDYMEELSDDLGEDLELDVIALCCDYSEYNLQEWYDENGYDPDNNPLPGDPDDAHEMMLDAAQGDYNGNIVAHDDNFDVIIVNNNM